MTRIQCVLLLALLLPAGGLAGRAADVNAFVELFPALRALPAPAGAVERLIIHAGRVPHLPPGSERRLDR